MPDGLRFALAIIFILLLMGILIGWMISQEMDKSPIEGLLERESTLIYSDKHFIQAVTPAYYPNPQIFGLMLGGTDNEMAELLDCIWFKESSRGQNMFGDYRNGKPQAFGHFQIWLKYHPVSYECAMDFECSAAFTEQKIREGKGHLWTVYKSCL